MTTDIRDGVEWKPWMVRFAEFEGKRALIMDRAKLAVEHAGWTERYVVGIPDGEMLCIECGDMEPVGGRMLHTDDLTEAIAAFHEAEERLLRGEL